jgi:quercetin dioxygenase-like cupin family protein
MRRPTVSAAILTLVLPALAAAQAGPRPEPDPGVKPTRLIDRAEVRVSRVELQPGATRSVHTHDDVQFHLWVPLQGTLQFQSGSDAPVAAASGQAFFLKRGTRHGFKNVGTTVGAALEVFVKDAAKAEQSADPEALAALAIGLAAIETNAR